jgi:hypothetical protein
MRMWQAQGCFTRARLLALSAHLKAFRGIGRRLMRPLPGSYAWPKLRREAEQAFARGDSVAATIERLRGRHAAGDATPPSVRTMRRWFSQGRWLRPATAGGASG